MRVCRCCWSFFIWSWFFGGCEDERDFLVIGGLIEEFFFVCLDEIVGVWFIFGFEEFLLVDGVFFWFLVLGMDELRIFKLKVVYLDEFEVFLWGIIFFFKFEKVKVFKKIVKMFENKKFVLEKRYICK